MPYPWLERGPAAEVEVEDISVAEVEETPEEAAGSRRCRAPPGASRSQVLRDYLDGATPVAAPRTRPRGDRFPTQRPPPRYRDRVADLPEPPPTDQQREAAVARLTEHIGAGHLTLAEFDERARASYRAGSAAELARVTADLPAPDAPQPARPTPRRWLVSLFGGADITGQCGLGP